MTSDSSDHLLVGPGRTDLRLLALLVGLSLSIVVLWIATGIRMRMTGDIDVAAPSVDGPITSITSAQVEDLARVPVGNIGRSQRAGELKTLENIGFAAMISGRVKTVDGVPLPSIEVLLFEESENVPRRTELSGLNGDFAFEIHAPGRFRIDVDDLPETLMAPMQRRTCGGYAAPPYAYPPCVEVILSGETHNVEVIVFPRSTVQGRVVGPKHEPVSGVVVRLQATEPGAETVSMDARTDGDGYYLFSSVYPARYKATVFPSRESIYHELVRPAFGEFSVALYECKMLKDLKFERFHNLVVGSVVDQGGRPVTKAAVIAYSHPGTWLDVLIAVGTDESGMFRLDGLPSSSVCIQVMDEWTGFRRLFPSRRAEPACLDLAQTPGVVELSPFVVHLQPTFEVRGKVLLGEGLPVLEPSDLRLRVVGTKTARLRIDDDWFFEWSCSVPHEDVVIVLDLVLDLARESGLDELAATRIPLTPMADEVREMVIRYPRTETR